MEVKDIATRAKEEFKQTEVGIIPQKWIVKPVEEIGKVIRGASPRPQGDRRYYGGNVPRLMVEDVTRDGKFVTPKVDFLTEEGSKKSRPCKAGTLTIVCSGTVGIPSFLAVDACIHDGFLALIDISNTISDDFLYHVFCSLREKFENSATHGGVFTNLTTSGVKEFKIPLPPTKAEQTAIATVLSDTDALINHLETLIEKKRAIKQGAMQQLLRPKEGWVVKKLGDVAMLKARIGWQGLTTAEYKSIGDYALITGTEFLNGFVDWDSCHFVEFERYKQDKNIQVRKNDVLVTKDGTIGKVAFLKEVPVPATLNSGVFVIRPIDQAFYPAFFYYVLMSEHFTLYLSQLTAGSTISHLYQKDFVHFRFMLPPTHEEQTRIAQILSDMDAEIAGLEQKLSKYKLVKQGMMQELLTGKTRLVAPQQI